MTKDPKVAQFLVEIEALDAEKASIIEALRSLVFRIAPHAREKMMYGGIIFVSDRPFCGLFVRKEHITIEFDRGAEMGDPRGLLEGSGRHRRHLKVHSYNDIKQKQAEFYITQSFRLENCPFRTEEM